MQFKVEASALNLRSEPVVRAATRLAVLPHGHEVTRLEDAGGGWWKVATNFRGSRLEGFVAHRFLTPLADFTVPPPRQAISAVHLAENRPDITRDRDGGRAFPLGETPRPSRRPRATPAEQAADLGGIVAWLDVERRVRYLPKAATTFCNIYACDYCYLAGVYLPRVWWRPGAIAALAAGREVIPRYGETIHELNANSLYDWLDDFGLQFGWKRVFDLTTLQEAANAGGIGLICAQRRNLNFSGHICVVVPERNGHRARREPDASRVREGDGTTPIVRAPLQSQAGRTNFRYGTPVWWTSTRFRAFGFWVAA